MQTDTDLIAEEAWYHTNCRTNFFLTTKKPAAKTSMESLSPGMPTATYYHKSTFASLCSIENQRPFLISKLVGLCKAEYVGTGGEHTNAEDYLPPNSRKSRKSLAIR